MPSPDNEAEEDDMVIMNSKFFNAKIDKPFPKKSKEYTSSL